MNAIAMNPCATPGFADDAPHEVRRSEGEAFRGLWRDGNLLVLTKGVPLPNI
jgi:hypothetical protein